MLLERPLPQEPTTALVLGAGRFGSAAARRIFEKWPGCTIHLADLKSVIDETLPGEHHPSTEAMDLLNGMLSRSRPDDIVVPCIPVHAAFNWVLSHLGFCVPVPVSLMDSLPGAVAGKDGCIFASLSDFVCPDDCREPEGYCPVTGRKRVEPLFSTMAALKASTFSTITVRSEQLLPGTGAICAGVFFDLLDMVRKRRGRFLIATASRCHGVVHGFTH